MGGGKKGGKKKKNSGANKPVKSGNSKGQKQQQGESSKNKKKKKDKQEHGESSQSGKNDQSKQRNSDELNKNVSGSEAGQTKESRQSDKDTREWSEKSKSGKSSEVEHGEGDCKGENIKEQGGERKKNDDDEQGSINNERSGEHHDDQSRGENTNMGRQQSGGSANQNGSNWQPQGRRRVDLTAIFDQLKGALGYVSYNNIHIIIQSLQHMQLWQIQDNQRFEMFKWILQTIIHPRANDGDITYFALVLAHLQFIPKQFFGRNYRAAVDLILFGLNECYRMHLLSPENMYYLKSIAHALVNNCSERGWLTWASHFYPCFGARALVDDTSHEVRSYKVKLFPTLACRLLAHIPDKLNEDELPVHKELLRKMFQCAPMKDVVQQVLNDPKIDVVFTMEEKKGLLQNFGKVVKQRDFKRKAKNLRDFLNNKRPQQHDKSNDALKLLTEFIESSDDNISRQDQEMFMDVVLKQEFLTSDLLHTLLVRMANKMSAHNLLLQLLNHESFNEKWEEMSQPNKLNLLTSYFKTKVNDEKNSGSKTTKAYAVGERISSVALFRQDKQLLSDLFEFISDKFLKNEDNDSVLKAYSEIENFTTLTQEHFKLHVKKLLNSKYEKLIIKPSEIMLEWSKSSFGQSLLMVVLNVLKIPKKESDTEELFKNMIKHCDIWTILLKANQYLEADANFKEGKSLWFHLKSELNRRNISVNFLDQINEHKAKLREIFRCLLIDSTDEDWFLKHLSQLEQTKEQFDMKKKVLESVIEYVKKPLSNYSRIDMSPIFVEYNKRNEIDWRKLKVNQLSDDFWGPLRRLNNSAACIEPLIKSLSFKQFLNSENTEDLVVIRSESRDVYSEVDRIIQGGLSQFRRGWNPIFNNITALTWKKLEKVIKEVKNDNELNEEFTILERYFEKALSNAVKGQIKDFVLFPSVLERIDYIIKILDMFEIDNLDDMDMFISFSDDYEDDEPDNLLDFHKIMNRVQRVLSIFITAEDDVDILKELSKSNDLYKFVKETMDEDLRFLVDAVEEHSDHFVSESIVSDLIEIHRFICPLMKKRTAYEVGDFLNEFKLKSQGYKNLAVKIQQCNTNIHSLEHLYKSVANRGEITKEIITSCLKKGAYKIELDNGHCDIKISYDHKRNRQVYSLSDLQDFRSRAHLIIGSHEKRKESINNDTHEFTEFILQVNLTTEIKSLLVRLQSSGYVKYRSNYWKNATATEDLQDIHDTLEKELKIWNESLKEGRERFPFLNFYRSDQLCVIYDFLTNPDSQNYDELLSLIHFVDRNKKEIDLIMWKSGNVEIASENPQEIVLTIGKALGEIFENLSWPVRSINAADSKVATGLVNSGELFIAVLDEDSLLGSNVLITLYESTCNIYPEPYQILFSTPDTAWEEIELLLRRCFYFSKTTLFCIVDVEQLSNEVQFKLVNFIKQIQQDINNKEEGDINSQYQLALICRGGEHHHIAQEFMPFSHHITGMSDGALYERMSSNWSQVQSVTSSAPGLGKTEYIRKDASQKSMNAFTFSISGPLDIQDLIKRLKKVKLDGYHCLHFDIGEVSDPFLLSNFLLQLIITGMVSFGTDFYHLPVKNVYIEIANSLNDCLQESLFISKYFAQVRLQSCSYDQLIVSSDVTSNVQVVCHYLDAYSRHCLDDHDIHFTGLHKVKALPAEKCKFLLATHYSKDFTFNALNTFLSILAEQLIKFSNSTFFKIDILESMLGDETKHVRRKLFEALLKVSKDFACRSVSKTSRGDFEDGAKWLTTSNMSAQDMVNRVKDMVRWEESNHLLVVFHGVNSQSIAAVYRQKSLVPENVEQLLKSQMVGGKKKELEDYNDMTQDELRRTLEKIASKRSPISRQEGYALTPDNILKMILIILRVRANVPVVIMGETGCGKTSLVRYLANNICQIKFYPFNFHAGISEQDLKTFINEKNTEAKELRRKHRNREQVWVFLDEINTCDHLGMINDIVCHHSLYGEALSRNLIFFAACNPYKLRPKENIKTAGLDNGEITDEYSKLVYRVHPLPEAMVDYVWDYGSLDEKDEKAYVGRMVGRISSLGQRKLLVDLLQESQKFIRHAEKSSFSVSLRDVNRCILLIQWFMKMTKAMSENNTDNYAKNLEKYIKALKPFESNVEVKSIVLALAHCYLSRLQTTQLRNEYRRRMVHLFTRYGIHMEIGIDSSTVDSFTGIIRMTEEDFLRRMELPAGTAKNTALRENVFVMLVSILNRIPIFVVGKPGCSKSLSMQLIRSNLRGADSKDPLFRSLPQLYVVSFQGSESSTSDGILKVFDKAKKFKEHNKESNVLPVVLLDEVGLAEKSKNNPLKVLHSLLEPGDGQLPEVAVVGISNWALDAAKMNRACHLSRPEPIVDDLYETGCCLYLESNNKEMSENEDEALKCLAEAYKEYQNKQRRPNFHGLRDYYSLIKSYNNSESEFNIALQRNFGGVPGELESIQRMFFDKLKNKMVSSGEDNIPVLNLVESNIADEQARHLMLITNSDSAVGILKHCLSEDKREIVTIYGSQFEEDLSEDYNYRILSRIILCMERPCVLVLRDLERIYGSLYDMLNQNYAVVGKRKNCRVALGAYSNPMCHVNDSFRCIVLTDYHKVDYSDPPFLNRFEKQLLRLSDIVDNDQRNIIKELETWVHQISTVEHFESHFVDSDMFVGFHGDTIPSLVLLHSFENVTPDREKIIDKCKNDLMWIATPDGVLRAHKSDYGQSDPPAIKEFVEQYFEMPVHNGLEYLMENLYQECDPSYSDNVGHKVVVMTYSTIHTKIESLITCDNIRLGAYKSEKQLSERIDDFWFASESEVLVLQCKPELESNFMLLARSIIEEKREVYKRKCDNERHKHVCIVIHLQRGSNTEIEPWQLSFLCGWKQVFLDVLEKPAVPLSEIYLESIKTLLTSDIWPLRDIAQTSLLWCFSCIKYVNKKRSLESLLQIGRDLLSSQEVYKAIERIILDWISSNEKEGDTFWQVKVACDKKTLLNSSTLFSAMESHVSRSVRIPLAKIIYSLEKENAWPPHVLLTKSDEDYEVADFEHLWCSLIREESLFNLSAVPDPLGPQSYMLEDTSLDLRLPFSYAVMKKVNTIRGLIMKDYQGTFTKDTERDYYEDEETLERYVQIVKNRVPEIENYFTDEFCVLYMEDMFDSMTVDARNEIERRERLSVAKAAFLSHVTERGEVAVDFPEFFVQLHLFWWTCRERVVNTITLVQRCVSHDILDAVENYLSCQEEIPFYPVEQNRSFAKDASEGTEGDNFGDEQVVESTTDTIQEEILEEKGDLVYQKQSQSPEEDESEEDEENPTYTGKETGNSSESDESDDESSTSESTDEEGSSSSEDEQENFEETLVTHACESMFPSQDCVKNQSGGLETWIQSASDLLSVAAKLSHDNRALNFLRLCVDFAKLIITVSNADQGNHNLLYIMNEIADILQPEYLDNENSFDKIMNSIIEPLKSNVQNSSDELESIQRFSALFYSRCLDTNLDTRGLELILEQILSFENVDLVSAMSPVLLRLLKVEQQESPHVFLDLITNVDGIRKHPCLLKIDIVLKRLLENGVINHDSYPAVMLCDLIRGLQKSEDFPSFITDSSDSKLLKYVRTAAEVVYHEHNSGLNLLTSIAFLRNFFTMAAEFISGQTDILKVESRHSGIISEINRILSNNNSCRRNTLLIYFLKQLNQADLSLYELSKLCRASQMLPILRNVFSTEHKIPRSDFLFDRAYSEYESVESACLLLINNQDDRQISDCVKSCHALRSYRYALMCVLANMIYLQQAERKITDKEKYLIEWFSTQQLPPMIRDIVQKITGSKDFVHDYMQLSPESPINQVELTALVLHVSCIVAVEKNASPLLQYMFNPAACKTSYILAQNRTESQINLRDTTNVIRPDKSIELSMDFSGAEKTENALTQGYIPLLPVKTSMVHTQLGSKQSSYWYDRNGNMDQATYRCLHLIVHICLYAGVAIGVSTEGSLSQLLNLTEMSFTPAEYCLEHVKADLDCLAKILNCKKKTVFKIMHIVVGECAKLIASQSLNLCSKPEELANWEKQFTNVVKHIFPKATGSAKELKETGMADKGEEHASSVIDIILETDTYPCSKTSQEQELKRLFRNTRDPSFDDFYSTFMNTSVDTQKKHGFLTLFFTHFPLLAKIGNLIHLLNWTRFVSADLTHHVSRKDVENTSIDDYINGFLLKNRKRDDVVPVKRELFQKFEESWNDMCPLVNNIESTSRKMPRLTQTSAIGYCIVEGEYGIHLRNVVQLLVSMQNTVLDSWISYLVSKHQKQSLGRISTQEAEGKDVINFTWSDDLFQFAQNSSEYGRGEDVHYDFDQIEEKLADDIFPGRSYLKLELNKVIFAGEIFHCSGSLLTEIRELLPQQVALPDSVRQGLSRLKERRIHDARNLLQHIEALMFVLKFKLEGVFASDADTSLEDFVKNWSSALPSPFPLALVPDPAIIKLEHITVFYEALEDLLSDGAVEGLAGEFRQELSIEAMQKLKSVVENKDGVLKPQMFLNALRRFTFRYLSSEKLQPGGSLYQYLEEPSLWNPAPKPDTTMLPKELTLGNLYSVITILRDLIQSRKTSRAAKRGLAPVFKKGRRRSIKL